MLDKPVEVTKGVTEVLAIVYFSPEQVEEREGVHYSLESGHQVEWQKEENWMFRLSRHKPAILEWGTKVREPILHATIVLVTIVTYQ